MHNKIRGGAGQHILPPPPIGIITIIVLGLPRATRCGTVARGTPYTMCHRAVCTSPLFSRSARKAGPEEGSGGRQPYCDTNATILVLAQSKYPFHATVSASKTRQLFTSTFSIIRAPDPWPRGGPGEEPSNVVNWHMDCMLYFFLWSLA